jgi:hypothetical protein
MLGTSETEAAGSYIHFGFTQSGGTWAPAPRGGHESNHTRR